MNNKNNELLDVFEQNKKMIENGPKKLRPHTSNPIELNLDFHETLICLPLNLN